MVVSVLVGLGGVLVLPATAVGAADGDGSGVSVVRYGGADRYETSLEVAEAVAADAGGSLEWAVLVSGRRWTDAVVAAPVAGALGAPVLMTPPDELRSDALEFLGRVGVSKALVVGPEASGDGHGPGRGVDAGVLEALGEAGIAAERVSGADLYGTAVAAAGRVTPGAMGELGRTAVIANGEVFADALVAGPFAARGVHPVLLNPPGELHADVADYMGDAGVSHVVLMGGTVALSRAVEQSVKDLGMEVTRVAGSTRYDTAAKAAKFAADQYSAAAGETCFANDTIGVARARVPFDSFSAAPLLGRLCAPLLLADPDNISADTATYLDEAREANTTVDLRVFGGDAAVSGAAIDAYLAGDDPVQGESGEGEPDGGEAAGSCGGSAADPPSRLVHDPKSQDPAWSPDCNRIAYSRGAALWIARSDGTDARVIIPHGGAFLDEPAWSPDGTRIAYMSGRRNDAGHYERRVWVADTDGADSVQLTDGDVRDRTPAWSPDGSRIVFSRHAGEGRDDDGDLIDADRYLAVMNVDGSGLTPLTAGGNWDRLPAWSPDGESIAYISANSVWAVSADGGDERPVAGGAFWDGGVSWSPDGTALAFSQPNSEGGTDIITVEVDGIAERQVTDLGGWAIAPRWSPDGQRIAFTHYDQTGDQLDYNGSRYAAVAGSAGTEVLTAAATCKPRGPVNNFTAGFPLPDWAVTRGTVRIAVLFMDFPDAQASHTTYEETALGLEWAEEYLEISSYRKLDVEFVPMHRWLRARVPSTELDIWNEGLLGQPASQHAVELADPSFDFSRIDVVMTVLPHTHFWGGNAGGTVTADGATMTSSRISGSPRGDSIELSEADFDPAAGAYEWAHAAAHELAHNLGLLDLYASADLAHERPVAPKGKRWVPVRFGRMGLFAWFLTSTGYPSRSLQPLEMLAWSRWQLNWLHAGQVDCVTSDTATVDLAPVARTGGAVAMAAVPIDRHRVIVVESRRKIGYDSDRSHAYANGATAGFPHLLEEGVLVYTVDTLLGSGQLPIKVAGDSGNGQVDDFPVLTLGESVTVAGWTITVTGDTGDAHTVTITRNT